MQQYLACSAAHSVGLTLVYNCHILFNLFLDNSFLSCCFRYTPYLMYRIMPTWHKLELFGKKEPSNEKNVPIFQPVDKPLVYTKEGLVFHSSCPEPK